MDTKQIVAWVLIIAALNWGLVGLLNLNVIEMILGAGSILTKIVYIIVGLVGLYKAYMLVGGQSKK